MNALTRKIGPLPAYAYVAGAVLVIVLVAHLRNRRAGAATAAITDEGETAGASDASLAATGGGGEEYANTGAPYGPGSGTSGDAVISPEPTYYAPSPTASDDTPVPVTIPVQKKAPDKAPEHHGGPGHATPKPPVKAKAKPVKKAAPVHHKPSAHELHVQHLEHLRRIGEYPHT